MNSTENWERVLCFVDCMVLQLRPDSNGEVVPHVLLMRKTEADYVGKWSLIGGGMIPSVYEDHIDLCRSKLKSKAGIDAEYFEQVDTVYGKNRDRRGPSQTTLYFTIVPEGKELELTPGENAEELAWYPIYDPEMTELPPLAFDHKKLLITGYSRVINKCSYTDLMFYFFPNVFKISEISRISEILLNNKMSAKVARQRYVETGVIEKVNNVDKVEMGRKAEYFRHVPSDNLYQFDFVLRK